MIMNIEVNGKKFEINFEGVNQICGENCIRKHYFFDAVRKYFSTYKYNDFEQEYKIEINKEEIGRKYFSCIYIHDRDDIINAIILSKTSMMMKYLKFLLDDFEAQEELIKIDDTLSILFIKLNEAIHEGITNIELDYDYNSLLDMIQKTKLQTISGEDISCLSNYELLNTLLDLNEQLQMKDGDKRIILIENLDELISQREYKSIIDICKNQTKNSDSWFIFGISHYGYCVCDEELVEAITIINDVDYSLDSLDHLLEYVKNNYPVEINLSKEELCLYLENIVNTVGATYYSSYGKSMIIDKIISKSIGIKKQKIKKLNDIEEAYLYG